MVHPNRWAFMSLSCFMIRGLASTGSENGAHRMPCMGGGGCMPSSRALLTFCWYICMSGESGVWTDVLPPAMTDWPAGPVTTTGSAADWAWHVQPSGTPMEPVPSGKAYVCRPRAAGSGAARPGCDGAGPPSSGLTPGGLGLSGLDPPRVSV